MSRVPIVLDYTEARALEERITSLIRSGKLIGVESNLLASIQRKIRQSMRDEGHR